MKRFPLPLLAASARQRSAGGHQHRPKKSPLSHGVGYIASPALDFWLTGGVSVIVMAMLLLLYWWDGNQSTSVTAAISQAIVLQALVNWPHFMGAYGLLYRPLSNIKKYPFATLYIPAILLICLVVALVTAPHQVSIWAVNQDIAYAIWLVAAFYLAWHYTGQAWGMMATFSRLSGLALDQRQRWLLRAGLRLLLIWHVVWGAQDLPEKWLGGWSRYIPELLAVMTWLCVIAFFVGLGIWSRIRMQSGRWPDRRVLVSWLAVYMWYWVLLFMPAAYIWVQLSHALQYLAFPMRMQVNQAAASISATMSKNKRLLVWMPAGLRYYLWLVALGMLIFYVPTILFPATQTYGLSVVLASMVSIHHYFVDGCIWKISHPEVRRALFWHLPAQKAA
ncbi:hypothetical protein [Methylophilus sp. TWE2]|uniref:hypothetical protein n=1 Tax=Methylophilus sp. TWE2 TaxID=1662285 RepID=UPI000670BC76|nr:hypothetical protein [Methylophilus sp. TWE2]AKR42990.1 hypothetical protein ACJ67_05815 [Methylophilus sp. TWE2]